MQAPEWQVPVLQQFFVFAFILLAPFVGAFSDAIPKGQVMFISNATKTLGCLAMVMGVHPLLAYGLVGIGASIYSPAKYGILTEYLPADRLVWANGWMEGLTVLAVIVGAIIGGFLIGNHLDLAALMGPDWLSMLGHDAQPKFAIVAVLLLYLIAAIWNIYIPHLPIEHGLESRDPVGIVKEFWRCFIRLWKDPLGQVSLAVTSLFWGAGTTLRFIILAWAASALGMDMEQGTHLTALVAVGLAVGSVIAAKMIPLDHSVKVLPLGVLMGVSVLIMTLVHSLWAAVLMLIIIGALAGSFVIPMNALLQHRGHLLMGSGHSIAVQNLNENISILIMLAAYSAMIKADFSINTIIVVFGLFIAAVMGILNKIHGHDQD
jgi:MFS family permease